MTIILPDDLAAFERSFTAAQLSRVTGALAAQRDAITKYVRCPEPNPLGCECTSYDLRLFMPRFAMDTQANLVDSLRALGMSDAFEAAQADFTGIAKEPLFISEVIHQANIDVDEHGTEAAAATAVGMSTGGGCGGWNPLKTITLRLDRPFLFFVRDTETGAVLFMGQVTDPSAGKGS